MYTQTQSKLPKMFEKIRMMNDGMINIPVQVEEERQHVEPEFDERLLLVDGKCSVDVGGIEYMPFLRYFPQIVGNQRHIPQHCQPYK